MELTPEMLNSIGFTPEDTPEDLMEYIHKILDRDIEGNPAFGDPGAGQCAEICMQPPAEMGGLSITGSADLVRRTYRAIEGGRGDSSILPGLLSYLKTDAANAATGMLSAPVPPRHVRGEVLLTWNSKEKFVEVTTWDEDEEPILEFKTRLQRPPQAGKAGIDAIFEGESEA